MISLTFLMCIKTHLELQGSERRSGSRQMLQSVFLNIERAANITRHAVIFFHTSFQSLRVRLKCDLSPSSKLEALVSGWKPSWP